MNRIILCIGTTLAILAAVGCGNSTNDVGETPEPELSVLHGQLAVRFQSLSDLTGSSTAVLFGTVVSAQTVEFERIPFWVTQFRVEESIRGDIKEGEVLTIVETGGIVDGAPGERPIEIAFEGVRNMKVDERWMVFLKGPGHVGPEAIGAFAIAGAYQGKLRLADGGKLEFTGPDELRTSRYIAGILGLIGKTPTQAKESVETLGP